MICPKLCKILLDYELYAVGTHRYEKVITILKKELCEIDAKITGYSKSWNKSERSQMPRKLDLHT